jgi:endoglucanase
VAKADGWYDYKQRFLLPEGRIIDTGNGNISHSEGQGTGMLLAVFNDDKETFNQLWQWTQNTLYQQDSGLFAWVYDPRKNPAVTDKNNASDGDTLIAWALLKAGKKWQNPSYIKSSRMIQNALLKHAVINFSGYQVMLPGIHGFQQPDNITLNPSYFIFPAWKAFHANSQQKIWLTLSKDGRKLLKKMSFGEHHLPTDWVTLGNNGNVKPADKWPAQFGFDAVRVPLYIHWINAKSPLLAPFTDLWRSYSTQPAPAWFDVLNNSQASYSQSVGVQAIRHLVMGNEEKISNTLDVGEDYYSASLHLLAYWSLH